MASKAASQLAVITQRKSQGRIYHRTLGLHKERKKFWLLPVITVLLLFGALIVLTQGSAVAPFIYTLF